MKTCIRGCEFRIKLLGEIDQYYCSLHEKELVMTDHVNNGLYESKYITLRCEPCTEEAEELDIIEDMEFCPSSWEIE